MNVTQLLDELRSGEIIALSRADFEAVSPALTIERTIETGIAGPLHVLHHEGIWAAVEFPPGTTDVAVRPLADAAAVDEFIARRLKLYEAMWDGCGGRADYWGPGTGQTCRRIDDTESA